MVHKSDNDQVTVVGAGVTLQEAIIAYDALKAEGINIRVVDPFTLKPIDKELLLECSKATNGRFVTVEDHYPEGTSEIYYRLSIILVVLSLHIDLLFFYSGGLGEAVCGALTGGRNSIVVRRLAVREVPRSGPGAVLMKMFGIDSTAIIKAVKEVAKE